MLRRHSIYWYIGFSCIIFLLDSFSYLTPFKSPLEDVISPLKQAIFIVSSQTKDVYLYMTHFANGQKVWEEYRAAKKRLSEYEVQTRFLQEENEKLRSQLGAALPPSFQFVPAHVLSVFDTMEIDVGKKEGIQKGMSVISKTTFIGKIQSVGTHKSTVMLPTDPQITIAAKTTRDVKGIVKGQIGGKILLDKVLQKDPILLDDYVVTAADNGTPTNLIIGKIIYISSDDTSIYKQAKVEPALDFTKEKIVFVITEL